MSSSYKKQMCLDFPPPKFNASHKRFFKNLLHDYSVDHDLFIYLFKDFIYLFDREKEITSRQRGRQRQREAGSPLSREPDAGLDPRTLRL